MATFGFWQRCVTALYLQYAQVHSATQFRTREKRFIFRRETCDPPFTYVSGGGGSLQLPSLHTYSRPTPPVSLMDCLSWDFPPTKPPLPLSPASPCLSPPQDLHIPTAAVYQGGSLSLSPWVNPFVGGEGGSRRRGGRLPRFATYRYLRQKKPSHFFSVMFCVLLGDEMRRRGVGRRCVCLCRPPLLHPTVVQGGERDRFQMLILKNPPLVSSFPTCV